MQGSACESSAVWKSLLKLGATPMQQLRPRKGGSAKVSNAHVLSSSRSSPYLRKGGSAKVSNAHVMIHVLSSSRSSPCL
jgi:hypothetical protein